mgnify:CR=1 FL=1
MSDNDAVIIGRPVKDMYGAPMGKILGTTTDIDGSTQTVGINCGSGCLKQVPYSQLVIQQEVVIFIPKWRLDSQRLLREKELTVRRLSALMEIVSDNDKMKSDAELIHEKYKSKLNSLKETESEIISELEERVVEINAEIKSVKVMLFDAKVQSKSNEISQETFDLVKKETDEMLQHMKHEKSEIAKVKSRLTNLSLEDVIPTEPEPHHIQDSAVSYLSENKSIESPQARLPEPPSEIKSENNKVSPTMVIPPGNQKNESNSSPEPEPEWLKRMRSE